VDIKTPKGGELPEFVYPTPYQDWTLAWARSEFLGILGEEAPETREDLRARVSPTLQSAWKLVPLVLFDSQTIGQEEVVRSTPEAVQWFYSARDKSDPRVMPLALELGAWMSTHNLAADWILDSALRTLLAWRLGAEWLEAHELIALWPAWRGALGKDEQRLQIEGGWEPTIESRASARRRLLAHAKSEIDSFLENGIRLAQQRGFVRPAASRCPSEHLRWLVRYQVVGQTFTEIARDDGHIDPEDSGRKAVAFGAKQAAALVGLPLREPDGGAVGKL
jgi:hypothetical protein